MPATASPIHVAFCFIAAAYQNQGTGDHIFAGHARPRRGGHGLHWSGLSAGDHDLTLDAMNDNPCCVLAGDVNINVKP